MSRKRFLTQEDSPIAFSSNEDDVEGEGEGNPSMKKPETGMAAAEKKQVSDSGSGSEEEADGERKDPGSVDTKTNDDAKRLKSSDKDGGGASSSTDVERVDEKKRSYGVQRPVWFVEDEIALLQGLIDYEAVIGESFFTNLRGSYHSVEKSVGFDLSYGEYLEKISSISRYFKAKFMKLDQPKFAKPHSDKLTDLAWILLGPNRRTKTCTFMKGHRFRFLRR